MSKGKVLVIDDEDLMCDLIEQVLSMKDYSITTLTNSADALEEIKQKKDYDIIVADIRMPKVSGIDLLRASNAQNMNYQFILITGFYNLLAPDILKSLKPFGFIKKPFDINTLVATVEQALLKKREIESVKSK
ncbi:MAG: response regulator [Candidatus Anammoxibacter sp.]